MYNKKFQDSMLPNYRKDSFSSEFNDDSNEDGETIRTEKITSDCKKTNYSPMNINIRGGIKIIFNFSYNDESENIPYEFNSISSACPNIIPPKGKNVLIIIINC